MNAPRLYAGRPVFTAEERAERRRASKQASDRRARERKNANATKYRAQRLAKGLTTRGKEPARQAPRKIDSTYVAYSAPVSIPAQSVDEWLAMGGQIQREPAHWQQPTRYPMYAGGFV